jgi:hypothetical protein
MEPVTAQEMMTLRDTMFPFAKCAQARARRSQIDRRRKVIAEPGIT